MHPCVRCVSKLRVRCEASRPCNLSGQSIGSDMIQMFWPWRGAALRPLDARHSYAWFPAGNRGPTMQHIAIWETTSAACCMIAMRFEKATRGMQVLRAIISRTPYEISVARPASCGWLCWSETCPPVMAFVVKSARTADRRPPSSAASMHLRDLPVSGVLTCSQELR